ncbi:MAG: type VI secretion system-associated protein TagF [Aquirhabdus sp.]
MSDSVTQTEPFYFGKCPARGDFIRSQGHASMLHVLDKWVAQALEAQVTQSDWQHHYDQMPSLDFVFCSTRMPLALAGTLSPSRDTSYRRFPLITGIRMQVAKPSHFMGHAPVLLQSLWQCTQLLNTETIQTHDATIAMQCLSQPLAVGVGGGLEYQTYLMYQTVSSFGLELAQAKHQGGLVQGLIALGLLLQPVISQGAANLNKALVLPLPTGQHSAKAATFWLSLITGFIQSHAIELSALIYHRNEQPILLVGFQGADSTTLAGLMSGDLNGDHWVNVFDSAWIESYLENDAGLARLEQVFGDEQMPLLEMIKIFKEVFLAF